MRITAKADYAVRAAAELAAVEADGVPMKGEQLARSQGIPQNFLENILTELRRAGHRAHPAGRRRRLPAGPARGRDHGGRRVPRGRGPWPRCRAPAPRQLSTRARRQHLPEVWVALRSSLRSVLEHVTLADLASGKLPTVVKERTRSKDSWKAH